jgi:hypothetical protein
VRPTVTALTVLALVAVASGGCDSGSADDGPTGLRDTIGVNTHYASGGPVDGAALARLAAAGVSFIRNDLTWASVEKEPGVYDFAGSGFDELVDTSERLGLRILFILDYGNPLYGEARAVVDDEGRGAFAAFAGAAASRYGGRGHSWEIWNEPNLVQFWSSSRGGPDPQLYAELVRATAAALRGADPRGEIVAGALFFGFPEAVEALGLGLGGPRFLEAAGATDVLGLVNGVSLHFYRFGAPESVNADVESARGILERAGHPLPLWSGEWGYSTYDPDAPATGFNFLPAVTLDRQASYIARMLLFNYHLGLRRSVIFKDRDEHNPDPGNIEHHWGLMFEDLTAKPSLDAVATLTELIGDAGPPEPLTLGAGEHGLVFSPPDGRRVVALWSEQETTWLLRRGGEGGDGRIVGRDGADLTPADFSDGVRVTVATDDGPIYLLGDVTVVSSPGRLRGNEH